MAVHLSSALTRVYLHCLAIPQSLSTGSKRTVTRHVQTRMAGHLNPLTTPGTGAIENAAAAASRPAPTPRSFRAELPLPTNRLLWIVNLDPQAGECSGAGMRFINLSRELAQSGVAVFFAVNCWPGEDAGKIRDCLRFLRQQNVIEDFLVLEYSYPRWKGTLGALGLHPELTDVVLKGVRSSTIDSVRTFVEANGINVCMTSDRKLLFVASALLRTMPVIFDWTDSAVLYYLRALRTRIRRGEFKGLIGFFRDFQTNLIAEAYYGRRATFNLAVSPVDRKWLGRTNLSPRKNRLVMNGAKCPTCSAVKKIPNRLIFSGAMGFPPNYEGALWFLDEVFPLILQRHPDTHIVLAGINPVKELIQRANRHVRVTGFVPDMGAEIASSSLYVSPLISGSGFKNKIVEAIMNGTYVVGTPMSFEFLDSELRPLVTVTKNAEQMAAAVNDFLDNPCKFDSRLDKLQKLVISRFSWAKSASELLLVLSDAHSLYLEQAREDLQPHVS
jgi:glycosyltransferase involved in cell wall biosynthesis